MPKQMSPEELAAIEAVIATHPEGLSLQAIAEAPSWGQVLFLNPRPVHVLGSGLVFEPTLIDAS